MTTRVLSTPIVIFSFNRPTYLRRVLLSLRKQKGVDILGENVHLMQDGARSEFSGNIYAQPAEIDECVKVFKEIFPGGHTHKSPENIGIARNIRRGEEHIFEVLGAKVGYFFEDDLELGDNYILVMEALREALNDLPSAGYFAAYGDHLGQVAGLSVSLIPMQHNWGYGLFRSAWLRISEWIKPYNAIADRADYRFRSHVQIFEHYRTLRVASDKSSQDSAKTLACADLGIARVMTDACFATYIGADGQSFTGQKFYEMGYDRTVLCTYENPPIPPPTAEVMQKFADAALERAQRFRTDELDNFLQRYRAHNPDPDRIVDAQTAHNLFWLLLGRSPEAEALASAVGRQSFRMMRRRLLESREFRGNDGILFSRPEARASDGAIGFALKLLTGRVAPQALLTSLAEVGDPLEARTKILRTPGLFRAMPELRLAFEIGELRKARASGHIRLVIGAAGTQFPGWVATNEELLNLLKPETWLAWFDENSVEAMVAEHVWDYLDQADGCKAARSCFRFLKPGGRLRIAVADALMPDPEYQQLCVVGGRDGRKILYDHRRLANVLSQAGFTVRPCEYFDEAGQLHQSDWQSSDGHIGRSRRFDPRNKEGKIRFTSLIFDAIKP